MRMSLLALPVVLLAAAGRPAAAQNDNLLYKVGPQELRRIALRYDPDARDTSANQNGMLYTLQGTRDSAFLTVEGKAGETLRIYTRLRNTTDVSLRKINSWNRDKIHGRVYLDNDDSVVFEMTMWMRGGVSNGNIREWITLHFDQLQGFKDFIRE
jgi:hypothetical protein